MALRRKAPATPMGRAFEGAFEASIAVVVALALGYYCDRWLGTEPVFLFVGLVVGAVAGFRRLLRIQWPAPQTGGEHERDARADDDADGSDDPAP